MFKKLILMLLVIAVLCAAAEKPVKAESAVTIQEIQYWYEGLGDRWFVLEDYSFILTNQLALFKAKVNNTGQNQKIVFCLSLPVQAESQAQDIGTNREEWTGATIPVKFTSGGIYTFTFILYSENGTMLDSKNIKVDLDSPPQPPSD